MRLFNQVFGLKSSSFVDCEKVVTKRLKIKTSVELGLSQKIKTGLALDISWCWLLLL